MNDDEKPKDARERKERVIHARIPPGLEEDLRRLAEALRMPVSNLVRNILHDTVTAVDRVGQTVEELAEDVGARFGKEADDLRRRWAQYEAERGRAVREPAPPPAAPKADPLVGVFGFQPIVLAVAGKCAVCGRALPRGSRAHLGLTDRSGTRIFVDDGCLPGPDETEE